MPLNSIKSSIFTVPPLRAALQEMSALSEGFCCPAYSKSSSVALNKVDASFSSPNFSLILLSLLL